MRNSVIGLFLMTLLISACGTGNGCWNQIKSMSAAETKVGEMTQILSGLKDQDRFKVTVSKGAAEFVLSSNERFTAVHNGFLDKRVAPYGVPSGGYAWYSKVLNENNSLDMTLEGAYLTGSSIFFIPKTADTTINMYAIKPCN